jgi:quercetin dioxygenase-like cupin family protein
MTEHHMQLDDMPQQGRGPSSRSPDPKPILILDLTRELGALHSEETWLRGSRKAKTLLKTPHLRVTLVALKAGDRLEEHEAAGPVTIHGLEGRLRVTAGAETVELAPGQLLLLDVGTPHAVEAIEQSAFLLTIGWLHSEPPETRQSS